MFKERKLNIGPAVRKQPTFPRVYGKLTTGGKKKTASAVVVQSISRFIFSTDPNIQASILFAQNGVPYTFQNGVAFFHGSGQENVYPATVPAQPQVHALATFQSSPMLFQRVTQKYQVSFSAQNPSNLLQPASAFPGSVMMPHTGQQSVYIQPYPYQSAATVSVFLDWDHAGCSVLCFQLFFCWVDFSGILLTDVRMQCSSEICDLPLSFFRHESCNEYQQTKRGHCFLTITFLVFPSLVSNMYNRHRKGEFLQWLGKPFQVCLLGYVVLFLS